MMEQRVYTIYLDNEIIGHTLFEKADTSMGVVFGVIAFNNIADPYNFIVDYCKTRSIELTVHLKEDMLVSTRSIDRLSIISPEGKSIPYISNQISGMADEGFEITLEGVSYPLYQEEFPHHVAAYNNKFS